MSHQVYRRCDGVMFADVAGDIVALHIDSGQCYGMEEVTAAVWDLLSEARDLDRICDRLTEQYAVAPETCRTEVGELLQQLRSSGLIEAM